MTTCGDLIEETRRLLLSGQRPAMNALSAGIVAGDTTLSFTYDLGLLVAGAYIAIDLEIMYVWSASSTGKTAVVQRGMLGSTAASHSSGAIAYVNPKFPAFSVFQALNADLDDLSAPSNGLYQVVDVDLTYNPAIMGYDLTGATDVIDVLRVRAQYPGPENDWPEIRRYQLVIDASTSSFTSGWGLVLYEGGSPGRTIRVTYSAPFTHFTDTSTTLAATGLPASAADLPPLGAALRLTGFREVKRNFDESQGDTRRASEVPPNAQLAGYSAIARERARRIRSEADKIASTYPIRRKLP